MKRIACIYLLLLCTVTGFAKNHKEKNSVLEGIWQICQPTKFSWSDNITLTTGPYMKILSSDGVYNNVGLNVNKGSIITATGSWEQTSDSTYTEHIVKSFTDPGSSGRTSILKFKFITPKVMELRFKIDGDEKEYKEFWYKVTMPVIQEPGIPIKR